MFPGNHVPKRGGAFGLLQSIRGAGESFRHAGIITPGALRLLADRRENPRTMKDHLKTRFVGGKKATPMRPQDTRTPGGVIPCAPAATLDRQGSPQFAMDRMP